MTKKGFHDNNSPLVLREPRLSQRALAGLSTNTLNQSIAIRRGRSSSTRANTRNQQRLVNFDNVPATSSGTLYSGRTFSSHGVTFTSGNIPDNIKVGDKITFRNVDRQIRIYRLNYSTSLPNLVSASQINAANDVLIKFSKPVTSVQLITDAAPFESSDIVRLVALKSTGKPFEFRVISLVQRFDNGTASSANRMAIRLKRQSFSFALFQNTTELEGFDNLRFNSV